MIKREWEKEKRIFRFCENILYKRNFLKFLVDQGIYEAYFKNLSKGCLSNLGYFETPEEFIRSAFGWRKSKEGYAFWASMDSKWFNILLLMNECSWNKKR